MKYAFIIFSDPDIKSELVKAAHALHYAINLKRKGNEVLVYFEGLGEKILVSDNEYIKPLLNEALKEGIVYGACGYCASPPHLNIKDKLLNRGIRLFGDENDHKDLSLFIDNGYQIMLI
ncbi:hypothetical protein SJAV_10730 [Sulfurisphaera javensis]|uniref:Sulfur reduction protein DsrE n=1 Tax=Sulfurisphaera javensis TaxID=2049879 RepID=A0AAT9GQN4_9CREN